MCNARDATSACMEGTDLLLKVRAELFLDVARQTLLADVVLYFVQLLTLLLSRLRYQAHLQESTCVTVQITWRKAIITSIYSLGRVP